MLIFMNKGPIPIAVAAIRDKQGRLLLAKRRDKKFKEANGLWELPGGHVEFKEDAAKAVVRECLEETGLKVKILRLLPKLYNNFWRDAKGDHYHTILVAYECLAVGGKLHDSKHDYKISDLRWVWPDEIIKYKLLPKTKEIVALLNT